MTSNLATNPLGPPRISVIVPIYNVAAHVTACVHSILAQTFTDFEVLLVDDGATDGSGDLALTAAQGDPRFRLIRQENAGLGAARNTGLTTATGAFIAFVDSDDTLMPDYLMRLWQVLDETGGDWVACAIQSTQTGTTAADTTGSRHSAIHGQADLSLHGAQRRYRFDSWSDVIVHFPSAWNKLYRRSLIEGLLFDEGVWFEDHGFFHRAAARTDHIIHLPEALYIQTRGRIGQITTQDTDRVFEQFDVLDTMARQFAQGPHAGADEALARIASRLVFERSTAIADQPRRTRFATAARNWLAAHGLEYTPDWDPDIGLSWETEMAGVLPLSVVMAWDGDDTNALMRSLNALRIQTAPAHEVLIICQNTKAQRLAQNLQAEAAPTTAPWPVHWQVLPAPPRTSTQGGAFNHGLTLARGEYVVFLITGDAPTPWSLLHNTEAMTRAQAAFGITQMRLHPLENDPTNPAVPAFHNGMHDMALWPQGTPPAGPLTLSPLQALGLEAQASAKIFRRAFLQDTQLGFTQGPRSDWALCLNAALLAPVITYIPHASVTITTDPHGGMTRWQSASETQAFLRGHKELLAATTRTLPAASRATLPQGWQRRLFARALREQVYFGANKGRRAKAMMLLSAAASSWRNGYGAARAAGLDPHVGPRLRQVLNPLSFLRRTVLSRLGAPLPSFDTSTRLNAGSPDALHAFDLRGTGQITLRTEFRETRYCNIYFRSTPRGPALFHLSLRHAENQVVCNNQTSAGHWCAEISRDADLSAGFANVTITFTQTDLQVALNGQPFFDFEITRNNRFTGLQEIAGFDIEGDVRPTALLPERVESGLILDGRLALSSSHPDSTSPLQVSGTDEPLPLHEGLMGTTTALLPARLWRDAGAQGDLTITPRQGAALTITRKELLARIETLLTLPLAFGDSLLCLTVIEHVRYGALTDHLSTPARRRLDQIASLYRLQDFLYADAPALSDKTLPDAAPIGFANDAIAREVASAIARVAQSQAPAETPLPDPLQVVASLYVSPQATPLFFLTLAEFFCAEERDFDGLFSLAQGRNLLPMDVPDSRWSLSAALPYYMAAQDYARVCDILKSLVPRDDDWLVTAAVAWTLRRALTETTIPASARRRIFTCFRALVLTRSGSYWERNHCREMTRAAATLITHHHHLTPAEQRKAVALCLRVYGLSQQFWIDLSSTAQLPSAMAAARTGFAILTDPNSTPQARDSALQLFEAAHNVESPRLRRALFGPLGLPLATPEVRSNAAQTPVEMSDLPQMHPSVQKNIGLAALRHMAAPASAPVSAAFSDLARAAIPDLYTVTKQAPHCDIQHDLSNALADPQANMAVVLDALTQLSGAASGHLGLGMALAVIDRLHDTAPDQVTQLCDWMHQQVAQQAQEKWRMAPALVQPLRRLCQRDVLHPAVQHLLDQLDLTAAPMTAPDNAGLAAGNPVFDTVVTVISCLPYLETRIPTLRAGWLRLLNDLGVPYVIVVGGGDNTLRGDVLHLDAPDDYEGLPQKTLAAISWVHGKTRFGHMLKIDDDCFLNAPLFFGALSYRKFDYYGRTLLRTPGLMDRKWHQGKSSSTRGQMDLDKSPEPSEYADGGTGYTLSRTAMAATLQATDSPQGQHLIATSFMEDKLIGDLLALHGIHIEDEDYRISMRRRTYGAATPVAMWHNSFFASTTAPVHLVHMDTHMGQDKALTRLNTPDLWPRKIWPSYQNVKLGYQTNALELVSDEASVTRARDAHVAVVACMRNEMFMLPHFLAHYRKLGVEAFLIADNCSDDGTLEYLQAQPDVALFSVDTDYRLSHYGVAWQQAMMAAFRTDKWSLVADADELLVWQEEQTQTLGELLETPAFETADAARIFMLDMYPKGPLEKADFNSATPFDQAGFADRMPFLENTLSRGPYSNQPSWTSALRHRLIAGSAPHLFVAQKIALLRYKPWMHLSAGLHFVSDVNIAPQDLLFAHFKYNADFRRKAQAEVLRGQHFNDAEEYRKYLALTSEGRSLIYDPDLSAPWSQVPFVKRLLT